MGTCTSEGPGRERDRERDAYRIDDFIEAMPGETADSTYQPAPGTCCHRTEPVVPAQVEEVRTLGPMVNWKIPLRQAAKLAAGTLLASAAGVLLPRPGVLDSTWQQVGQADCVFTEQRGLWCSNQLPSDCGWRDFSQEEDARSQGRRFSHAACEEFTGRHSRGHIGSVPEVSEWTKEVTNGVWNDTSLCELGLSRSKESPTASLFCHSADAGTHAAV